LPHFSPLKNVSFARKYFSDLNEEIRATVFQDKWTVAVARKN